MAAAAEVTPSAWVQAVFLADVRPLSLVVVTPKGAVLGASEAPALVVEAKLWLQP